MGMNRDERILATGATLNTKLMTAAQFVAYMQRALAAFAEDHADTPDALESTWMLTWENWCEHEAI